MPTWCAVFLPLRYIEVSVGEVNETAIYLSDRTPHAALANETSYKALCGKDAYLGHLRAIGARAFGNVETPVRKLEHRV